MKILKLGDICEISTGSTDTKDASENGQYPLFDRSKKVKASDKYLFDCEALIMPGEGAEFLPRHYIGKFDLHQRAYAMYNFSELINPLYLYYYLISVKNYFADNAVGATVKSLRRRHFTDLEVPLPSLEKQSEIVTKLDGAFAEIADLEMRIDLLKNFISEMESSTLNGVLANSKRKLRIGDICTVTSSKRIFKSEYVEDGIPFYRTKELKELANNRKIRTELFISRERFSEIKNKYGIPINGDLLISAVGTIGEVLVIDNLGDFYFKDGNIVWLKSISRDFDSDFLAMCLRNTTKMLNDTAQGSAYSALTIEKLVEIEIPEISKKEQLEIIKKFSELSQAIKEFEYNLVKKNELVFELRKSFLRDALEPSEAVA